MGGKVLKKRVMRRTDQAILGVDVSHGADSEAVAGATLSSKFVEDIINEKSKPFIEAMRRLDLD